MKTNILNKVLVFTASVATAMACTANFAEINRNPYGITDEEMQRDGYAVRAALIGMASGVISPDINTTQFTECLLGGTMAGYMADANAGWKNTISNYNPTDDWSRVFMKSDRIIPVIYSNYKLLHQVTEDPAILAVGEIIKVTAMHRVTDTFGPIPYSRIGQNGEINVPYDKQADVYRKMFEELDAAIAQLEANDQNFSSSADVIYGGDVHKWIKFANSLKLRLAMRISYADPELSRQMAEAAVNHKIGVMTSNDDNAKFTSWTQEGNAINVAVEYNMEKTHSDGSACLTESGDSHAAADIICYMNGYSDPRRSAYFTKTEFTAADGIEDEYLGLRRCITIPNHKTIGHKFSGIKIAPEDPAYWMNAAEVAFLKAEAVAVFGYNMGESAQTAYERGVRLSFEQWGATGVDQYLSDNVSTPQTYNGVAGVESGTTGSVITVKWDDSATPEVKQERIITQKWIANWLIGNESWADWRRTGYPRLLPGTATGNLSQGVVDNKAGARRMPYPVAEQTSNKEYYQQAVNEILNVENNLNSKKGDIMSVRLWFDCKTTNPSYSK